MAYSWKGGLEGAISGGTTGAAFGPWGVPIGATIGLAKGFFGNDKSGSKSSLGATNDRLNKVPTGIPEQEALHKANLAKAMGMGAEGGGYEQAQDYYRRLLGPDRQAALNETSDPYIRQFQEQIVPMIGERYAGLNALDSSGFQQTLGGAAGGLQAQLAQMFEGLRQQAAGSLTNQYNQLTNTGLAYSPFEYVQEEGSKGGLSSFFKGLEKDPQKAAGIIEGIMSLFKSQNPSDLSSAALDRFAPNYTG